MSRAWRLSLVLATLLAHRSEASVPDAIGLGSEESAVAGASAARVRDFSAAHYNPAGLSRMKRPEVSIGMVGFFSLLKIRTGAHEGTAEIANPWAVLIGAGTPVPFTGVLADRLWIGLALVVPPDGLARVIARTPETPFFPLYDNRTQRLVVLPAIALRLPAGVSLGVGLNYLAGLDGRIQAAAGATRAIEARVDEAIRSVVSVNAGVRWQATRAFALGLTYRQAFGVPLRTLSRNRVAGQPIDLDVDAVGLYTPHQLVLGSALELPFRVVGSLDVQWSHWSAYAGPFVTVASELPLIGRIDTQPPPVSFNDTITVRGGLDWTFMERRQTSLKLRGGYAFENAAAPSAQPGVTNLLDAHKHRLALGSGVRFELLGAHLRGDIHGALDILQPHTLTKDLGVLKDERADLPGTQVSNPGWPQVSGSGVVWALGFTVTVEAR